MTMRERIQSGKLFTDACEGFPEARTNCKKSTRAFNTKIEKADLDDERRLRNEQ